MRRHGHPCMLLPWSPITSHHLNGQHFLGGGWWSIEEAFVGEEGEPCTKPFTHSFTIFALQHSSLENFSAFLWGDFGGVIGGGAVLEFCGWIEHSWRRIHGSLELWQLLSSPHCLFREGA
eukprot:Gb_29581 [translate_table: standard]